VCVNWGDSCTAVEKKKQNLLCRLSGGTDSSSLLDFQFDSAVSGLGNNYSEYNNYTLRPKH